MTVPVGDTTHIVMNRTLLTHSNEQDTSTVMNRTLFTYSNEQDTTHIQ